MDEPETNFDKAQALKAFAEAKQIESDIQIKERDQKLKIVNNIVRWFVFLSVFFGIMKFPVSKEAIKWVTNFSTF